MDADRRTFIKSAALSGAAPAWTGGGLIAAAADQPVTSASEAVPLAPPDKQPPKLPLPEPAPRKVGWAVVGLGQLALEEVMPAFREARLSQPVALVSGHADKARKVAEAHGISADAIYSYDTYARGGHRDQPSAEGRSAFPRSRGELRFHSALSLRRARALRLLVWLDREPALSRALR